MKNPLLISGSPGFSLVEVVISIGIFTFCVASIIYLLGTALTSSRDSSRDSALAATLPNVVNSIRMNSPTALESFASSSLYFDQFGNALPAATSPGVYYQVSVAKMNAAAVTNGYASGETNSGGVANTNRYYLFSAAFTYPAPGYKNTNTLIFGNASYDPQP